MPIPAPPSLIIPLIGSLLLLTAFSRATLAPWRRRFAIVVLVVTLGAVLFEGFGNPQIYVMPFWGAIATFREGLGWSFDWLSLLFSLLLAGAFALTGASISDLHKPQGAISLLLLGAGIATFGASNLLTVAFFWVITDTILALRHLFSGSAEGVSAITRSVFLSLVGTLALLIATVWTVTQLGNSGLTGLAPASVPVVALMVAAYVRLGIYPLPGKSTERWSDYLVSLCTGAYLWLRLGDQAFRALPGASRIVPFLSAAVLLSAVLSALAPTVESMWERYRLYGAALVLLAPLLDPQAGVGIGVVIAISLVLLEVLVQFQRSHSMGVSLLHWARVPGYVALGSLLGVPFTLGFTLQWTMLWLLWNSSFRSLTPVLVIAHLLTLVAVWRRIRPWLLRTMPADPRRPWLRVQHSATAVFTGLLLLIIGFNPTLVGYLFLERGAAPTLPNWRSLITGDALYWVAMLFMTVVLPAGAVWLLSRAPEELPPSAESGLMVMQNVLSLHWLYRLIEKLLGWVSNLASLALRSLEDNYLLGWTLLAGMVVALYLVGR